MLDGYIDLFRIQKQTAKDPSSFQLVRTVCVLLQYFSWSYELNFILGLRGGDEDSSFLMMIHSSVRCHDDHDYDRLHHDNSDHGDGSEDGEENRQYFDLSNNDSNNNDTIHDPADISRNHDSPSLSFSSFFWSRLTWLEVSGSCGDFGTLFPLLVALARERRIHLAPTLFGTGCAHLVTGWYWNHLPMPLQPMHMISAQALSDALKSPTQVATAGVGMGISFLILQWVGGVEFLHKCIPKSVIGGLQLGVGWKVALKGLAMIQTNLPWWGQVDCIGTAIMVSALTLYGLRSPSTTRTTTTIIPTTSSSGASTCQRLRQEPLPVGLFLFGVGVILAAVELCLGDDESSSSKIDLHRQPEPLLVNALKDATWEDWTIGLGSGTLPQLPLTVLNSCLSVCLLAETLFHQQQQQQQRQSRGGHPVSRKSVCWSIGLMNTIMCPLGVLPHCHGAGGLAGQVRLGATSGVSMIMLGIFKLLLSFWAAQGSLLVVLDALPISVLGVLLALSGHELALTGIRAVLSSVHAPPRIRIDGGSSSSTATLQATNNNQDISIALITAMVIVGTGMAHVGALCGWSAYLSHGNGVNELSGYFHGNSSSNQRRRRTIETSDSGSSNDEGGYGQGHAGEYLHVATTSEED